MRGSVLAAAMAVGCAGAAASGGTITYEFTASITHATGIYEDYVGGAVTYRVSASLGAVDIDPDPTIGHYDQIAVDLAISASGQDDLTLFSFDAVGLSQMSFSALYVQLDFDNFGSTFDGTIDGHFHLFWVDAFGPFATDALPMFDVLDGSNGLVGGQGFYFTQLDALIGSITFDVSQVTSDADLTTIVPLPTPLGLAAAGLLGVVGVRRRR